MTLRTKLYNLKTGLAQKKTDLKNTGIDDITRIYQKILSKIPDISHLKNIVLFSALATLTIFILFAQRFSELNNYLPTKADFGGIYTEGIQGEINQLNPLYSQINNAETSATSLIFSGLTKRVDGRKVAPDLAERWEVSTDKKTYTFYLRPNLKWHDGQPLTAEDVIFTFSKILDPDTESPYLAVWKGVEVTAVDVNTVSFRLPREYALFMQQTNVPIIPKHLLETIPSINLKESEFSKAPVGSGPFIFEEFVELKDHQEVRLKANPDYYGGRPHLAEIILKSYKYYYEVVDAYKFRDVLAIERLSPNDAENSSQLPNLALYDLSIPEYDTLVFNLRSGLTKDLAVRNAISAVIDRDKIVDEVYKRRATPIRTAILPGFTGYTKSKHIRPDYKTAGKVLKAAGYIKNKDGILIKDNSEATLRLVTLDNDLKNKEAELLAEMVRALGFRVEIERYPFSTYAEDYVRTRNYDILLVSQNYGADSDFYAYYHSNMVDDPGLNLSGIDTRELDKYIEEARTTDNPKVREARYLSIAKILNRNIPAVYICWPNYIFAASKDIKGIVPMKLVEPKDKYSEIGKWYIKEIWDY